MCDPVQTLGRGPERKLSILGGTDELSRLYSCLTPCDSPPPSNPGAPDQDGQKKDVCVAMRIVPFLTVLIPDLFFVI